MTNPLTFAATRAGDARRRVERHIAVTEHARRSFPLAGRGPVTSAFVDLGIGTFDGAVTFVATLPYRRPDDRLDALAVLREGHGTCSGKHALLALLAREQGRADVEIVLCIYEMREANTPGVGRVLAAYGLESVPEAHCFLRWAGTRIDATGLPGGDEPIDDSVLAEEVIDPVAALTEKPRRHRRFVKEWASSRGLDADLVWRVREECIEALQS